MEKICENWALYLLLHVAKSRVLFNASEFPWEYNERCLVSTLAASITRSNSNALVMEELPVPKKSSSNRNSRCDLWAHVRDFNFYLEAKKFKKPRESLEKIEESLNDNAGISRMLRDYIKPSGILSQKSIFNKDMPYRKHTHFIIGMIAIPIIGEIDVNDLEEVFQSCFSKNVDLNNCRRKMGRFPTTALFLVQHDKKEQHSMLATFSVLGKSS